MFNQGQGSLPLAELHDDLLYAAWINTIDVKWCTCPFLPGCTAMMRHLLSASLAPSYPHVISQAKRTHRGPVVTGLDIPSLVGARRSHFLVRPFGGLLRMLAGPLLSAQVLGNLFLSVCPICSGRLHIFLAGFGGFLRVHLPLLAHTVLLHTSVVGLTGKRATS